MGDEHTADIAEYRFLGVRASAMTIAQMNRAIGAAVSSASRFMIVSQNLHSVYVSHKDEILRLVQESATHVRIDGLPIIYFGRWLGHPLRAEHRTGWMDWLDPFMTDAVTGGWRIHYVGSKPGVADRGSQLLRERYPGLAIDSDHGYFALEEGSAELESLFERIQALAPDVLIVGMGMPRQEHFVDIARRRLAVPVILTAGACMDYVVGDIPIPPRWLGRIGLEWAYRLASEPRRLWRRYLLEPWFAVGLFLKEWLDSKTSRGG